MLHAGLQDVGITVTSVAPKMVFSRFAGAFRSIAAGKWLGYLDKFVVFPTKLRRMMSGLPENGEAMLMHVLDHSNAAYLRCSSGHPALLTCHDLLAIRSARGEFPQNTVSTTGRAFQRWIHGHLQKARWVACVSEATRTDWRRLLPHTLDDNRLRVIPVGLNAPFAPETHAGGVGVDPVSLSNGSVVDRPYFLHVGNNSWYKNRMGLLEIFARIASHPSGNEFLLVLAGCRPDEEWMRRAVSLGLIDKLIMAEELSFDDLRLLYCRAQGLIFPSWAEGFGWPVVEAQACGCPVFASNRPPLTDVGGKAAVYFDPADPDGAAKIILSSQASRSHMQDSGMKNAARFSPRKMVDDYVQLYREIVAQSGK
jgi:glycosyltransferase involved in cell wall biosynthesis